MEQTSICASAQFAEAELSSYDPACDSSFSNFFLKSLQKGERLNL